MNIFEKNGHAIIWGDTLEALATEVPDGSVDLVFADPPYNIGKNFNGRKDRWPSDESYLSWCYQWLELCIAKLKPSGSLYVMTATQNMPFLKFFSVNVSLFCLALCGLMTVQEFRLRTTTVRSTNQSFSA